MIRHTLLGRFVDPIERFWLRVEKTESCWNWLGSTEKDGYGRLDIKYKHYRAHVFSWTLHNGPVPDGLFICHKCNNRRCVNPDHLYAGTPKENAIDTMRSGNCAVGEGNGNSQLNETSVKAILNDERPYGKIAKDYGTTETTIYNIKNRKTWKHIPYHSEPVRNNTVSHNTNTHRGANITVTNAAKTHCDHGHEFNEKNTRVLKAGTRRCRICEYYYTKGWRLMRGAAQ
jgi:hypothetical protein